MVYEKRLEGVEIIEFGRKEEKFVQEEVSYWSLVEIERRSENTDSTFENTFTHLLLIIPFNLHLSQRLLEYLYKYFVVDVLADLISISIPHCMSEFLYEQRIPVVPIFPFLILPTQVIELF